MIKYTSEDLLDHDAIAAVIKDDEGRILMQEHIKLKFWTIPIGKADQGKSPEEGMKEEVLEECGIPIIQEDVGGKRGRKIYFNTAEFTIENRFIGEEKKDFTDKNIRVLIVDDSAIVRSILRKVIESTPGIEVAGEAADAFEARDLIISLDPDVISLDIIMPRLDGLKFLQKIMEHFPKPVIIVSTIAKKHSDIAQKAQKLGAVGVVDKDSLEIYKGLDIAKQDYIPMIRTAANRKVTKKVFV